MAGDRAHPLLVFEYAVQARSDERVVAEAKTVVVCYDYVREQKKPVPTALKASILARDPLARVEI